jgi:cytochrome bd ubiquinol oxidase subunit I
MMELDPLLLSRLQFAFVVSFHAIFPVFTIGLAAYIAVLETITYKTRDPVYAKLSSSGSASSPSSLAWAWFRAS